MIKSHHTFILRQLFSTKKVFHNTTVPPNADKTKSKILIAKPLSLSRSGKNDPITVKKKTNGINQREIIEKKIMNAHQMKPVNIPNAV